MIAMSSHGAARVREPEQSVGRSRPAAVPVECRGPRSSRTRRATRRYFLAGCGGRALRRLRVEPRLRVARRPCRASAPASAACRRRSCAVTAASSRFFCATQRRCARELRRRRLRARGRAAPGPAWSPKRGLARLEILLALGELRDVRLRRTAICALDRRSGAARARSISASLVYDGQQRAVAAADRPPGPCERRARFSSSSSPSRGAARASAPGRCVLTGRPCLSSTTSRLADDSGGMLVGVVDDALFVDPLVQSLRCASAAGASRQRQRRQRRCARRTPGEGRHQPEDPFVPSSFHSRCRA